MSYPQLEDLAAEIDKIKQLPIEELVAEIADLKKKSEVQKIIVVPKERVITRFTGGDVSQFVREVNALWGSRETSKKEKLDSILENVGETVRAEIGCHPKVIREDPVKLLQALEETYGDRRSVSQLLGKFYGLRQREDEESVREFSHRLHRVYDTLIKKQAKEGVRPLEERLLRDHFMEAVAPSMLRKKLKEVVHEKKEIDFHDLRDIAIRWAEEDERGSMGAYAAKAQDTTLQLQDVLKGILEKMTSLDARLSSLERGQQDNGDGQGTKRKLPYTEDGKPICLKCRKPGHIAKKCPEN